MPAIVTFNVTGPGLFIEEIDTGGDNELDLTEIYSEWKVWSAQSDNLKYPPAFRQVGSDPITDIQNLGATWFLNTGDGWRIRPSERDHYLQINGNLWTDPPSLNPIAPTVGGYTVLVREKVSNLVDASVARLDLTQLLQAVYIDTANGVPYDPDDESVGTPTNPVSNLADAFTIATAANLKAFEFVGTITLDRDAPGWKWKGSTAATQSTLDANGYDLDGSLFERCTLTGDMDGRIECVEAKLDVITGLDGVFRRCGLVSSFSTAAVATVVMQDCISEVPGTGTPVCTVGATTDLSIRNYSGGIELQGVAAGTTCSIDLDPGHLIINDASNTGGVVVVRGVGRRTVDTGVIGTTVVQDGLVEADKLAALALIRGVGLDTGETLTFTNPVAGGAAGTQTFSGGGLTLTVTEATDGTITISRTA